MAEVIPFKRKRKGILNVSIDIAVYPDNKYFFKALGIDAKVEHLLILEQIFNNVTNEIRARIQQAKELEDAGQNEKLDN